MLGPSTFPGRHVLCLSSLCLVYAGGILHLLFIPFVFCLPTRTCGLSGLPPGSPAPENLNKLLKARFSEKTPFPCSENGVVFLQLLPSPYAVRKKDTDRINRRKYSLIPFNVKGFFRNPDAKMWRFPTSGGVGSIWPPIFYYFSSQSRLKDLLLSAMR